MSDTLQNLLESQGVVILDGGLATELEARGHDLGDKLWSARLLLDRPDDIREVHLAYLEAGADVIASASYQATVPGFVERGLSPAEAESQLRRSVEVAVTARDEFWAAPANRDGRMRPLVAASVGPYGAFLADGSEFTGDYDLDAAGLADFHRARLATLAGCGADLLACETVPSATEARVLVSLLEELQPTTGAWISFSCRDGEQISDGTPIGTLAAEIGNSPALLALGVNCTPPRHIESLVTALRQRTDLPIVAYPNSGELYDAKTRDWLPGDARADLPTGARRWVAAGARLVGGCCRTGPDEIRRLRRLLLPAS